MSRNDNKFIKKQISRSQFSYIKKIIRKSLYPAQRPKDIPIIPPKNLSISVSWLSKRVCVRECQKACPPAIKINKQLRIRNAAEHLPAEAQGDSIVERDCTCMLGVILEKSTWSSLKLVYFKPQCHKLSARDGPTGAVFRRRFTQPSPFRTPSPSRTRSD